MTVSVANQLYRPSGLSEQGRLVLSLIDGGIQWLDWAMQDQQARYQFSDEGALVAGVQAGLHASRLLLLPRTGLAVSPVKLMTLSTADLRTLAQAETGDPARAADAAPVLAAQGLVTHDNLAAVPVFLQNLQVADAPLFQAMGLDDRFPVLALRNDPDYTAPIGSPLPREAAAFAVAQARTPQEFVDYYRVYLRRAALGTPADTPEQRAARAQQALDTLLPLSFGALDAPGVDGLVPPWEVVAAIREWLLTGRQIGFSRASLVVQQVVANAGYADQAGDDAAALVRDYLARAQRLLKAAEIGRGQLGQDGVTCTFTAASDTDAAEIELGSTGTITLRSFARVAATGAVPQPPQSIALPPTNPVETVS